MKNSNVYIYAKIIFFIFLSLQFLLLLVNLIGAGVAQLYLIVLLFFAVNSMVFCLWDNVGESQIQRGWVFFLKALSYISLFTLLVKFEENVYFFISSTFLPNIDKFIKLVAVLVYLDMVIQYLDRFLKSKIDNLLRQKTPFVILMLIKSILVIVAITVSVVWVFNISLAAALFTSTAVTGGLILLVTQMMKESITNFFSGLLLVLSNPFQIDDTVTIDDVTGMVKEFNWRGVSLIEYECDYVGGNHILLPNELVLNAKITNHTRLNEKKTFIGVFKQSFFFRYEVNVDFIVKLLKHALLLSKKEEFHEGNNVLCYSADSHAARFDVYFKSLWDDSHIERDRLIRNVLSVTKAYSIVPRSEFDAAHDLVESRREIVSFNGVMESSKLLVRVLKNNFRVSFPYFSPLSDDDIDSVFSDDNIYTASLGDVIIEQGNANAYMYLILYGVVSVNKDDRRDVARLGVSALFGESSVVLEQKSTASVIALIDSVFLRLSRDLVKSLCQKYPDLSMALFGLMNKYAQEVPGLSDKGINDKQQHPRQNKIREFFGLSDGD